MPWNAADPGTIAQDAQGAYHIKQGDAWIPAPKGSIAKDAQGAYHVNTDSLAPPAVAAAPPPTVEAPPPPHVPGVGEQVVDAGKDLIRPIAKGVGAAQDLVTNAYHAVTGGQVDTTYPHAAAYAAKLDHPDDNEPLMRAAGSMLPGANLQHAIPEVVAPVVQKVAAIPAVHDAINSPVGRTVGAVGDVAGGVLDAAGIRGVATPLRDIADTVVNKVAGKVIDAGAGRASIQSNPIIGDARASGYKLGGGDVNSIVNAESPNSPRADIPGPRTTAPDTLENIRRDNQTLRTHTMASDVGLENTRSIDPKQVAAARTESGKVYDELGAAIGPDARASQQLQTDIANAAPKNGASAGSRAGTQAQVDFHLNEFRDGHFNGPDAVQTVRDLRQNAYKQMGSMDVDTQSIGKTNLKIADAIESELMRQLPAGSDLATRFPAARTRLAKLSELEAVTDAGSVNANKVLQLKKAGAPLSGASLDAATAAEAGPESNGVVRSAPESPLPVTHTGFLKGARDVASKILHKLPGNDPSTEAYQEARYGKVGKPPEEANTPPPLSPGPVTPAPAPVDPALAVGAGRASATRRPTKSGPSGGLIPEVPDKPGVVLAPELAVGSGRASPSPSGGARSGTSGYSDLATATPEHPAPPAEAPVGLGVGQGVASPTKRAMKPGPSGYSHMVDEPAAAAPPVGLGVGQGVASPTRTPTVPGASGYSDVPVRNPFELSPPEGTAFEPAQRPLDRTGRQSNAEGDQMVQADWDRAALDRINRYKASLAGPDERLAAQGPVPRPFPNPATGVETVPRNQPAFVQGSEERGAEHRRRMQKKNMNPFNQDADNAE